MILRKERAKKNRDIINKSREKEKEGKIIKRSNSEDWVKIRRRRRRNCSRGIVR